MVEKIRSAFPALERRHNGHPVAYFDGPGGTQVPRTVADAMSGYLLHHNANTHWAYPTSAETDALLDRSRATLAAFLNAAPSEITFGANMTTLTFHLARALGRGWGAGDEIVITELDHHANVAPWQALAKERGVSIRVVRMDPESGTLDFDDLARALTPRCRLLAIGAASNALGTVTDVRRATEMAHAAGALVFVDAVHYAPHVLVGVQDIGCDFLACSPYKFYGPHIGTLWTRGSILEQMDVPKLIPAPDTGGERLETGTQNHEGIVGAAAAVEFLASIGEGNSTRDRLQSSYDVLHHRAALQVARLWDGLSEIRGVRLFGPQPDQPRTSTASFTLDGTTSTDVVRALVNSGLFLSHGDFYATTVIERLGVGDEGLVRVGCACYTTDDEVQRLIEAVSHI